MEQQEEVGDGEAIGEEEQYEEGSHENEEGFYEEGEGEGEEYYEEGYYDEEGGYYDEEGNYYEYEEGEESAVEGQEADEEADADTADADAEDTVEDEADSVEASAGKYADEAVATTESSVEDEDAEPSKETEKLQQADDATKAQIHRNRIVNEILETEKVYVKSLEQIVKYYMDPLRDNSLPKPLRPQDVKNVFSEVEIILNFNSTMLLELKRKIEDEWSETQCLGAIFIQMTHFLKVYQTYINNYENSLEVLAKLKKNIDVTAVLENAARETGYDLESLLIRPVQRIPRYVLLLKDLLKHTEETHPDYDALKEAFDKMKATCDHINTLKRRAEGISRLLKIRERLVGYPGQLVLPHRELRLDAKVQKHEVVPATSSSSSMSSSSSAAEPMVERVVDRWLFLFNDLLVETKKNGKKFEYLGEHYTLPNISLLDVPTMGDDRPSFVVMGPGVGNPGMQGRYLFADAKEKTKWRDNIRACCAEQMDNPCLGRWDELAPLPVPVVEGTLAYVDGTLWLYGGRQAGEVSSDLYFLAVGDESADEEWALLDTSGSTPPPPPRRGHSCTVVDKKLLIFGGLGAGKERYADVHIFDTETREWSQPACKGMIPPARSGHSAVLGTDNRRIFVFGGAASGKLFNDLHIFDTQSLTWTSLVKLMGSSPPSRYNHTAGLYQGKIWICGGSALFSGLTDTWVFDTDYLCWQKIHAVGDKPAAEIVGNVGGILSGEFVSYGGRSGDSQVFSLACSDAVWHKVELDNEASSPAPYLAATAIDADNGVAFVAGGQAADHVLLSCSKLTILQPRKVHQHSSSSSGSSSSSVEATAAAALGVSAEEIAADEKRQRKIRETAERNQRRKEKAKAAEAKQKEKERRRLEKQEKQGQKEGRSRKSTSSSLFGTLSKKKGRSTAGQLKRSASQQGIAMPGFGVPTGELQKALKRRGSPGPAGRNSGSSRSIQPRGAAPPNARPQQPQVRRPMPVRPPAMNGRGGMRGRGRGRGRGMGPGGMRGRGGGLRGRGSPVGARGGRFANGGSAPPRAGGPPPVVKPRDSSLRPSSSADEVAIGSPPMAVGTPPPGRKPGPAPPAAGKPQRGRATKRGAQRMSRSLPTPGASRAQHPFALVKATLTTTAKRAAVLKVDRAAASLLTLHEAAKDAFAFDTALFTDAFFLDENGASVLIDSEFALSIAFRSAAPVIHFSLRAKQLSLLLQEGWTTPLKVITPDGLCQLRTLCISPDPAELAKQLDTSLPSLRCRDPSGDLLSLSTAQDLTLSLLHSSQLQFPFSISILN